MIDQRVSEGILSNFFNEKALTTTIPAQLIKKFNIAVVPIYIERIEGINFRIKVNNPIKINKIAFFECKERNCKLQKVINNKTFISSSSFFNKCERKIK